MLVAPHFAGMMTGSAVDAGAGSQPGGAAVAYDDVRLYDVTVAGVPVAQAEVARKAPIGTVRGHVFTFGGTYGTAFLGLASAVADGFHDELVAKGYGLYQVRWPSGWSEVGTGPRLGPAKVASRVATLVKHLHGLYSMGGDVVLYGHSGGAAQIGYLMGWYNLRSIITRVVLQSGPPYADLDRGCRDVSPYNFDSPGTTDLIDDPWGYAAGTGPCTLRDSSVHRRAWWANSQALGMPRMSWGVPIDFVFAEGDTTVAKPQGELLATGMVAAAGDVVSTTAPGGDHNMHTDLDGRTAAIAKVRGREPYLRQDKSATAAAASVQATWDHARVVGAKLIAVVFASGAFPATPTGWTLDVTEGPSTNNVNIFSRTADNTATDQPTWTATGAGATTAYLGELAGITSPTLDEIGETTNGGTGTTITVTTPATGTARGFAVFGVALNGTSGGFSAWSNLFSERAEPSTRTAVAVKPLSATGAVSSQATWASSRIGYGAIAVYTA